MKLRFDVDQAECFRRGIDCEKSIVTIEVNPAKLSQEQRNLIADRMDGIDVCELGNEQSGGREKLYESITNDELMLGKVQKPFRIKAKTPTFESLMEAILLNEKLNINIVADAKPKSVK